MKVSIVLNGNEIKALNAGGAHLNADASGEAEIVFDQPMRAQGLTDKKGVKVDRPGIVHHGWPIQIDGLSIGGTFVKPAKSDKASPDKASRVL